MLRKFPNGTSTSTLPTFNSLANLLTICRRQGVGCARLLSKARTPGGAPAADTLAAVVNLARSPWHDVRGLYKLSLGGHVRGHWQPSLGRGEAPDAWTLALLFEGNPRVLDGPGNFAIDAEGNLWVANNYAYSRKVAGTRLRQRSAVPLHPDRADLPRVPISRRRPQRSRLRRHDRPAPTALGRPTSASKARAAKPRRTTTAPPSSPPAKRSRRQTGWEVGGISWPQGTVVRPAGKHLVRQLRQRQRHQDRQPTRPRCVAERHAADRGQLRRIGRSPRAAAVAFARPFGAAVDAQGNVFVTGNGATRSPSWRRTAKCWPGQRRRSAPAAGGRRRQQRLRLGVELEAGWWRRAPACGPPRKSSEEPAAKAAATSP